MSRYIDADTIDYKHYLQHKDGEFNYELLNGADNPIDAFYAGLIYLHNRIEETPTADVEKVVYCGDCAYRGTASCQIMMSLHSMKDDDFCSYGTRRES